MTFSMPDRFGAVSTTPAYLYNLSEVQVDALPAAWAEPIFLKANFQGSSFFGCPYRCPSPVLSPQYLKRRWRLTGRHGRFGLRIGFAQSNSTHIRHLRNSIQRAEESAI